jgi:uncharacterized protein
MNRSNRLPIPLSKGVLASAFALAGLMAVLPGLTSAQEATPAAGTASGATITVNGHGSVMVRPDAASATIGVTITEGSLTAAQQTATDTMNAVLEALRGTGIADDDIQTASYYVQVLQQYDENGMPSGIDQFQVSNQVNVIIRDIDAVGATLDAAVEAGANTIFGVNFIVTDPGDAAAEARALAVQDARTRAENLASAAGVRLGDIASISETFGPQPIAYGRGGAGADAQMAVPIEPGNANVSVDVQIVFEIAE